MPTKIEWAEETINPVRTVDGGYHCTKISPGCSMCYAERFNKRFGNGKPFDAAPTEFVLWKKPLQDVLRWRKPRLVFVQSMGDLFHPDVPFEIVTNIFGTMHSVKKHTYMILTKRPERMAEFIRWYSKWIGFNAWPREYPHVWLGVTAENQEQADKRIPVLLQTPAAVHYLSIEPMLSHISLSTIDLGGAGRWGRNYGMPQIDWVICGGETGPGARPMHPDWARSLRDQCQAAGVSFFFKQHGEWMWWHQDGIPYVADGLKARHEWPDKSHSFRVGKKAAGRLLDGREWNEMPEA